MQTMANSKGSEQSDLSDLDLHCLHRQVCGKPLDHFGTCSQ